MGTNASITGADLIDLEGNKHCFMCPLSNCTFKISIVCHCRFSWLIRRKTRSLLLFLTDSTCTAVLTNWWSWLTQTELAGWQQTHESLSRTWKNWKQLRQPPHCTPVVYCLQRVQYLLQLLMRLPWQKNCHHIVTDSRLRLTVQVVAIKWLCRRNDFSEISRSCPVRLLEHNSYSEALQQTLIAFLVQKSKISSCAQL